MQYRFEFQDPDVTFETLVTGPAIDRAVAFLKNAQRWPGATLSLVGPPKSGKTTLMAAWLAETGGIGFSAEAFQSVGDAEILAAATGAIAVDDADQLAQDDRLLWLLNLANTGGGRVLLTAQSPPARWGMTQPDLVSRLKAMLTVDIVLPDEGFLKARFEAACHRHYLGLSEDVWRYLSRRVPHDYAAMEALAEDLCQAAAGSGRGLTLPVALAVLGDGIDGDKEDVDD